MSQIVGKNYEYVTDKENRVCYIYPRGGLPCIGAVGIDKTNAWSPLYLAETKYLPINSALRLLDYSGSTHAEIE